MTLAAIRKLRTTDLKIPATDVWAHNTEAKVVSNSGVFES